MEINYKELQSVCIALFISFVSFVFDVDWDSYLLFGDVRLNLCKTLT